MNGVEYQSALISGANQIARNQNRLDELNVFPVPDGDTGTNMTMTSQAAASALLALKQPTVGEAATSAASAMLRGARGNSGVILSLLFRGMAAVLKNQETLTPSLWAQALDSGVREAYGAVMKPTEGTVLTVARLAAAAASGYDGDDLKESFRITLLAAKKALLDTPNQLLVLKKAGVVDAGGQGFVYMLEGMQKVVKGDKPVTAAKKQAAKKLSNPSAEFESDITYPYCTEYIVNRTGRRDPLALRAYLESIGDCVVVVSDEDIIKVHVHTDAPGNAITEGLKFGWLTNMKIDNMRVQHEEKAHAAAQSKKHLDYAAVDETVPVGFVAVAAGDGVQSLFEDLGADRVVSGGQTMNPSTEDLLEAIQSVGAQTVVVLPNNKNIIMASEQAAGLADRKVVVMQTRTIPEGIAAMLAFDPAKSLKKNQMEMVRAIEHIKTGLVTFAARDSYFDGKKIGKHEILALENGRISFTENDVNKAAYRLMKRMVRSGDQFATILYGDEVTEEMANDLYDQVKNKLGSQLEINLVPGKQPVYYYILSVE